VLTPLILAQVTALSVFFFFHTSRHSSCDCPPLFPNFFSGIIHRALSPLFSLIIFQYGSYPVRFADTSLLTVKELTEVFLDESPRPPPSTLISPVHMRVLADPRRNKARRKNIFRPWTLSGKAAYFSERFPSDLQTFLIGWLSPMTDWHRDSVLVCNQFPGQELSSPRRKTCRSGFRQMLVRVGCLLLSNYQKCPCPSLFPIRPINLVFVALAWVFLAKQACFCASRGIWS